MKCEKCGQPSDGWPGDAGELCQMCLGSVLLGEVVGVLAGK